MGGGRKGSDAWTERYFWRRRGACSIVHEADRSVRGGQQTWSSRQTDVHTHRPRHARMYDVDWGRSKVKAEPSAKCKLWRRAWLMSPLTKAVSSAPHPRQPVTSNSSLALTLTRLPLSLLLHSTRTRYLLDGTLIQQHYSTTNSAGQGSRASQPLARFSLDRPVPLAGRPASPLPATTIRAHCSKHCSSSSSTAAPLSLASHPRPLCPLHLKRFQDHDRLSRNTGRAMAFAAAPTGAPGMYDGVASLRFTFSLYQ